MPKTLFVPADTGDLYLLLALRDRVRTIRAVPEPGSFLTATVADGSARARRDRRIAARVAVVPTPAPSTATTPATLATSVAPVLLDRSRRTPVRPMPIRPGLLPVFRAA
jgi:hypothetical protein